MLALVSRSPKVEELIIKRQKIHYSAVHRFLGLGFVVPRNEFITSGLLSAK